MRICANHAHDVSIYEHSIDHDECFMKINVIHLFLFVLLLKAIKALHYKLCSCEMRIYFDEEVINLLHLR